MILLACSRQLGYAELPFTSSILQLRLVAARKYCRGSRVVGEGRDCLRVAEPLILQTIRASLLFRS